MAIGHLYVLFGEVSTEVLCLFLIGVFDCLFVFLIFGVEFCKYFINLGY